MRRDRCDHKSSPIIMWQGNKQHRCVLGPTGVLHWSFDLPGQGCRQEELRRTAQERKTSPHRSEVQWKEILPWDSGIDQSWSGEGNVSQRDDRWCELHFEAQRTVSLAEAARKKEKSKEVGKKKAFWGREEKQSRLRVDSSEEWRYKLLSIKVNTNENQTKPKQPPKQNNLPNKTTTTKPQKQSERRNEMETDPCSSSNPMNELDYLHLPPMVPSSPL